MLFYVQNKTCMKLNIIPKFINIHIKRNLLAAVKTKIVTKKFWVNYEIKFLYSKI